MAGGRPQPERGAGLHMQCHSLGLLACTVHPPPSFTGPLLYHLPHLLYCVSVCAVWESTADVSLFIPKHFSVYFLRTGLSLI